MLRTLALDLASAALRRPLVAAPGGETGAGVAAGVGTGGGGGGGGGAEGEDMLAGTASASVTFTGWLRWMHRFFLALQSAQAGLFLRILMLFERADGKVCAGIMWVRE